MVDSFELLLLLLELLLLLFPELLLDDLTVLVSLLFTEVLRCVLTVVVLRVFRPLFELSTVPALLLVSLLRVVEVALVVEEG